MVKVAQSVLVMVFCVVTVACGGGGGGGGGSGAGIDVTPPVVLSMSPVNHATGVAVNSVIEVVFSEEMAPSSIGSAAFILSNGVTGTVVYGGSKASFVPLVPLEYSTTYVVTVTGGVTDLAGNAMSGEMTWSFTTVSASDSTAPIVVSPSPAVSASSVEVNSVITAIFNEPMLASSINVTTFYLDHGVEGTVNFNGTTATFTPANNLMYSTVYTATVSNSVSDEAGNAMASSYVWSFTTIASPMVITDTGISMDQCHVVGSNVLVSCIDSDAIALSGSQDGMIGLDVDVPVDADGKLGFRYSTVDAYGMTDCIQDDVTGLMWEGKADSGMRADINTYTNFGDGRAGDASSYVSSVNATGLCGFNDWRLPTADELQSIVNYGVAYPGPTVDGNWFLNTQDWAYWTSSSYAGDSSKFAWVYYFDYGDAFNHLRDENFYVRLVRGGVGVLARYTVSNDGEEVSDLLTGLIWRRCAEGMSVSDGACVGSARMFTHEASLQHAAAYAASTGKAWRLPNVKELSSIVDRARLSPAIDVAAFPGAPAGWFWSSTPSAGSIELGWYVDFADGYVGGGYSRAGDNQVRLVRSGQ